MTVGYAFVTGDVFTVDLPRGAFSLVYADPPYAGCRFKYARQNGSRQWGRNARQDFMRELIARVEDLRHVDGVGAISMGTPELALLHLFPSKRRVFAWVKNWAQFRPGVWPTFAWEPVVAWGKFPPRGSKIVRAKRPGGVPFDWLTCDPVPRGDRKHETPKPPAFADWLIDLTLGPRRGSVCELFAGTAPVAKAANALGMAVVAVDLVEP